jgi:hypothetical protein
MDSGNAPPEFLSLEDHFARYAPEGEVSLNQAIQMVARAISYCRAQKIEGLLADVRKLHGFPHPTVVDRYWFIRKWAEDARGQVVLALIQRPEMIDSEQIGVTIASNAGLVANVFESEPQARAWLVANLSK